jgi:hypothetical protein
MMACRCCFTTEFVVRWDGVLTCMYGHPITLWNGSPIILRIHNTCNCGCFLRIADDGLLVCASGRHSLTTWNGFQHVPVRI